MNCILRSLAFLALLLPALSAAQEGTRADSVALRLVEAGFTNVRVAETAQFTVFTVENDYYKLPAEGFARAAQIIEGADLDADKPVKLIGTSLKVPEVTMTYDPQGGSWRTTKRLDASWDAVRKAPKRNNSFGKLDINVYPQVSLKNLIITQVYQSLWQLCPTAEVSLWPGGKLSFQVKIPIVNDGFGTLESLVHPGYVTVSQRFRDPWHLNIFGRVTLGIFNAQRIGGMLELAYWFPNERFWVDAKLGLLDLIRFGYSSNTSLQPPPGVPAGFWLHLNANPEWRLSGYLALNYYNAALQTQFILRGERYLLGDVGLNFEMIRHFRRCSIGFYLLKGTDPAAHTNGGFRFQVALPPFGMKRHGNLPRITTSGQMGMSYNANNEQYYYKKMRTDAADNIMSRNYYNPYYINKVLNR